MARLSKMLIDFCMVLVFSLRCWPGHSFRWIWKLCFYHIMCKFLECYLQCNNMDFVLFSVLYVWYPSGLLTYAIIKGNLRSQTYWGFTQISSVGLMIKYKVLGILVCLDCIGLGSKMKITLIITLLVVDNNYSKEHHAFLYGR